MKFSRDWLGEYVELPKTEELARLLTDAGLAVELIEEHGEDVVLDIDVTTNRPDAMNHLGIAREVAVLSGEELVPPSAAPREEAKAAVDSISVSIEDERCHRYAARVVEGVRLGPSPPWLARRLEAIGLRPINNVVDVTNYVLWEMGQPLHAFDLAKIAGGRIVVRPARQGEALVTLDGEERKLDSEIMVIADAERAVALAGIMGGAASEVTENTVDVLLESAHFERVAVRSGAKKLAMHTDASHRFERGSDPEACARAASRAALLLAEVAGGRVLAGIIDERADEPANWHLRGRLDLSRLEAFMGTSVDPARVEAWLSGLGFELAPARPGIWHVTVPSWRYYDFADTKPSGEVWEADLFEEVIRVHGYGGIPATLPAIGGHDSPPSPEYLGRRRTRGYLAAAGFSEVINYAFVSPAEADSFVDLGAGAGRVELANALSRRYSVMRPSILPGLLASARFNQRRGAHQVRQFEVGRVFFDRGGEGLPDQPEMVALVLGGSSGTPFERGAELDFFDAKGAVDGLAALAGVRLSARPAKLEGLVGGASAEWVDEAGERVGVIGQVEGDDAYPLFAAELTARALLGTDKDLRVAIPSRFPGIAVDLTLTHALTVSWAEISSAIRAMASEELEEFGLKDRYSGKGVADGAVNTTIWFQYGRADRSLTQDEINESQGALSADLASRFAFEAGG